MKVIVGMSGGVDSSVAAYLLKEKGYEVYGAFFRLFENEKEELSRCCDITAAESAGRALRIPVSVIDVHREFEEEIVNSFFESYEKGITPNPCTVCNEKIKFGVGFSMAINLFGEGYFATGHYARIEKGNGIFHLKKGIDTNKDQSYMLWRLRKDMLNRVIFPLGELTKQEVYEISEKLSLPPKKESEDLCFIQGKLSDLLKSRLSTSKGSIVDPSGKVLGEHNGFYFYTIGQRSGLNVSSKEPLYVISLDPVSNIVVLGKREECMFRSCEIDEVNVLEEWDGTPVNLKGKVRYRSPEEHCVLKMENDKVLVEFFAPQFAITPGQSLVLYKDDYVFLGGVIKRVFK